eukprot:m.185130 g.185130  ORF g.185130 m.185130 type:complete len:266 (+) comp13603_c0_seq9:2-799(+)
MNECLYVCVVLMFFKMKKLIENVSFVYCFFCLFQYADDCFAGAAIIQSDDLSWKARFESIQSMYPSSSEARDFLRRPVHEWSIPVLDLEAFERDIQEGAPLQPYMFPANNFFQCFALRHSDLPQTSLEYKEDVARVATAISASIVDSLWAAYYVSQDLNALKKIAFLGSAALTYVEKKGAEGDAKKLLKMIAEHAQHSNSEDDTQNEGKEDDDEGMDIQGTFNFDPQGNGIVSVGASAMVSLKKAQAKMGMIEEHLKQISSLHAS